MFTFSEEMRMFLEVGKLVSRQRAEATKQHQRLSPARNRDISGKATEQIMRQHLMNHGLNISMPRVGIEHSAIEIDLIYLKALVNPSKFYYRIDEVDTVLEIKNNAVADQTTEIKKNFDKLRQLYAQLRFAAIVLSEREGYKYAIKESAFGYPVFTLITRSVPAGRWMWSETETREMANKTMVHGKRSGKPAMQETGEWSGLLEYLSRQT
ncbi:MAG TPA: hypothetical protein VK487_00685 [Candidatus Bathyarchaeia archaeon]|nr:hypothetical protein [Candidatus Bathyarchaeia archaeon]